MFKTVVTLLRGRAHDAERRLADRNALSLLDQQMRDAGVALARAKKALAIASAQDQRQAREIDAAQAQIRDLEARAVAALKGGCEELAQKSAVAIATREADVASAQRARGVFAAEIARLEAHVRKQSARLAELERGRRIAQAAEAVRISRRGRLEAAPCTQATLAEAESTLARLREKQIETEVAEIALDALDAEPAAETLVETLANQGFGPPTKPRAADVLARLKEKAAVA